MSTGLNGMREVLLPSMAGSHELFLQVSAGRKLKSGFALPGEEFMRSPSLDFALRASLRVSQFAPGELLLTDACEILLNKRVYVRTYKKIGIGAVRIPDRIPLIPPGMRVRTGWFEKLRS